MTVRDHAAIAQMVELVALEGVSINEAATRVAKEATGCAWRDTEAVRRRLTRKYHRKFQNRVIRILDTGDGDLFYIVYDEDFHSFLVSKGLWKPPKAVHEIRTKLREPISKLLIARLLGAEIGPASQEDRSANILPRPRRQGPFCEQGPYMDIGFFLPFEA